MVSVGIDLVGSSCPFLVGCLLVVGAFSFFRIPYLFLFVVLGQGNSCGLIMSSFFVRFLATVVFGSCCCNYSTNLNAVHNFLNHEPRVLNMQHNGRLYKILPD
jgi:polyferredoxin